jgi:large subunit ribosomal protein LX
MPEVGRYFPLAARRFRMSEFTVRGSFPARFGDQEFEKRVDAPNEDVAIERVYANFGSQHGLKRTQIAIDGVDA